MRAPITAIVSHSNARSLLVIPAYAMLGGYFFGGAASFLWNK